MDKREICTIKIQKVTDSTSSLVIDRGDKLAYFICNSHRYFLLENHFTFSAIDCTIYDTDLGKTYCALCDSLGSS